MDSIQESPLAEGFEMVSTFCAMTEAQRVHATTWAAATRTFKNFPAFARLDVSAPGPGCGKTTILEVVTALCPMPLVIGYSTQASIKNWLDEFPSTTLGLDERDKIMGTMGRGASAKELIAMLNVGYAQNGQVLSTRSGHATLIPVYNAVAHAGIGRASDELTDRSITLQLTKKMPAETWISVLYENQMARIGSSISEWLNGDAERKFLASQPAISSVPGDPRHKLIMAPLEAVAKLGGYHEQFLAAEHEIVTGVSATPLPTRGEMLMSALRVTWGKDTKIANADDIREMLSGDEWDFIAPGRVGDIYIASLLRGQGVERVSSNNVHGYRRSDVVKTDHSPQTTDHRPQTTIDKRNADALRLLGALDG